MNEEKKKNPEEEEQKKSETPQDEKPQEESEKEKPAPDDKQADEDSAGADKAEDKPEPDKPPEKEEPKPEDKPPENVPDPKDEEILRLKTQIAAMQIGLKPECVEDAVAIAESYVKSGKAKDTQAALSEVVKKYPDMKGGKDDKSKGGFKVGADSGSDSKKADDNKLSQAFGIKKKGKV